MRWKMDRYVLQGLTDNTIIKGLGYIDIDLIFLMFITFGFVWVLINN